MGHSPVGHSVAGWGPLLAVAVRQDLRRTLPWLALVIALVAASALGYPWAFPDLASRQALASTVGVNPAFSLLLGPPQDLLTADGFTAWRTLLLGGVFTALMAVLAVVRNSRAAEDGGQAELIASAVVGRHARLAVAVAVGVLASLAMGFASAVVGLACGGRLTPIVLLSAGFAVTGVVFSAVAAVTAQLAAHARTANLIAFGVLGASYLLRGYVDASGNSDGWVVWLTPLGWVERLRPAGENNPWPLLACLALAAALIALAVLLEGRRDFGAGVLPDRCGPARGGMVTSVWGLALRLHQAPVVSWTVAFLMFGTVFGFLARSGGQLFVPGSPLSRMVGGAQGRSDLVFAFVVMLLDILGVLAAAYGVQAIVHVATEEEQHRVDPLLAGSLSRVRYLLSNAVVAFVGPAVALVLASSMIAIVSSWTNSGPGLGAANLLRQALVEVPAVWVLVALAVALVGVRPRARGLAFVAVVATFALTLLGPMLRLPGWVLAFSPLHHVPDVTTAGASYGGLAVVAGLAVVLTLTGLATFHRRDIG